MGIKREHLTQLLDRANAFDLLLGARARIRTPVLTVLCYHSVGDPGADYEFDPDVIDATPDEFYQQLRFIEQHCNVVGINEICHYMEGGSLPPNPVAITFDDGYRSCIDVALPILQKFGFPAVFFIATSYVTERRLYWWETIHYLINASVRPRLALTYPKPIELDLGNRRAAISQLVSLVKHEYDLELERFLADLVTATGVDWNRELETQLANRLIMTWDDIRVLRKAGMDIESHTRNHRVLQTLSMERLAEELAGSRADIEREIGELPRTVAYPVGYSIRHIPQIRAAVERAGYKLGFSNATGTNYLWRPIDAFNMRRIGMERGVPVSMFRGQLAFPPIAFSRESV